MIKEETKQKLKNNIDYKKVFLLNNTISSDMSKHASYSLSILMLNNINFYNTLELRERKLIFNLNHIICIDENIDCIIFTNCTISHLAIRELKLNSLLRFDNCAIDKLTFSYAKITEKILLVDTDINNININNCEFNEEIYINEKSNSEILIDSVKIKTSRFNKNFKFQNSNITKIEIKEVDFTKNADFTKSKFLQTENINFENINFENLAIFGECEFHAKCNFNYVAFKGLAHFIESTFFMGLHLDNSNIEKEMNFYGVKKLEDNKSVENTSQETYRILKYNCERIGNIIDSNKYHALELEKKKENLYFWSNFYFWKKKDKNRQYNKLDWLVFNTNYITSKFGTNWLIAFLWIIFIGFFTSMYIKIDSYHNYEYIFEYVNKLDLFKEILADTPKYMSIINGDELKKYSVAFLLNKVFLGYLYYQFVTAVRKDTRK